MSFGSRLLGKPSHEALLKLLENEIKILETIKKTIFLRMKSEKDYTTSLTQLLFQYSKLEVPSYESLIYNAWKGILLDISQTSQASMQKADGLLGIHNKLEALSKVKIQMKKNYLKERNRIDEDLLKTMHSRLNEKQSQYTKMEEELTIARKNYDQEVAKGKMSGISRARDKYRKSVMKLHKSHNSYILQLEDAKLHQSHYRSHTLPRLLDGIEHLETEFVAKLKDILSDYVTVTSPCQDDVVLSHKLMKEKTAAIDPVVEHKNFMETHKADLEDAVALNFLSLAGESTVLPKEKIILNSLTLQETENHVEDYSDDIDTMQTQINEEKTKLKNIDVEIAQMMSEQSDLNTWFTKQQDYIQAKLTVSEQEDMLTRLQHLHSLVSTPLKDLGKNDPPSGLDLPDLDSSATSEATYSSLKSNLKKKLSSLTIPFSSSKPNVELAKVPSPPGSTSKLYSTPSPKNFSSATPKHYAYANPPSRPKALSNPPLPQPFVFSPSGSNLSPSGKTPMTAPLPRSPVFFPALEPSDPLDPSKPIHEQSCFHGAIPRLEAEALLNKDGDFLLRLSKNSDTDVVLSARCNGQFRHFILTPNSETGRYHFGGASFASVFEMVTYFYKTKSPMSVELGIYLLNPIEKDEWQMSHDDIEIREELGSGSYGVVYLGVITATGQSVAVKTCRDTVDKTTKAKFLMEASILKGYDHPNIVKLIGVATDKHPIYIVMELVTGGDLRSYLRKNNGNFDSYQLICLCRGACAGMAYLEEKKCIHRDLAARNCLVTKQEVVKISDFGMSRQKDDGVYNMSGANKFIPVRWTAPEAMFYGQFSSASDVWSFGILSWETFAFGATPYPGMTNVIVHEEVSSGYRLPRQVNCPERYYTEVMSRCWLEDANKRPRFSELLTTITDITNKF